jgi:hypothetical protein
MNERPKPGGGWNGLNDRLWIKAADHDVEHRPIRPDADVGK